MNESNKSYRVSMKEFFLFFFFYFQLRTCVLSLSVIVRCLVPSCRLAPAGPLAWVWPQRTQMLGGVLGYPSGCFGFLVDDGIVGCLVE